MSGTGAGDERGFSIVEVVISLVIFAVAMTGLVSMSVLGSEQLRVAGDEDERWAVSQEKLEELIARDTANLTSGSDTIRGYPLGWTVTKGDPSKVVLLVTARDGSPLSRTDTLVTYVDNR